MIRIFKKAEPFLPFLVAILAAIIAWRRAVLKIILYGDYETANIMLYNIMILRPNYFENGFIRRGLGGTLLYLIDGSSMHPSSTVVLYQLIGAVFLLVPMALMLRRLVLGGDRLWLWFAGFILLSPQLFWGWARDSGRSDMLVCGFIAWSVVSAVGGRFTLAAVVLFIGSLVHETAVIYGGPLLVSIWFLAFRQHKARPSQGVFAVLLLLALLLLAALAQQQWGDDVTGIAKTVRRGQLIGESAIEGEFASYMTWGGFGLLKAASCLTRLDQTAPWVIAACVLVLLANFRVLFDRTILIKGVLGFVSLMPMIFMSVVATDYGRWLMFAVANAWLAAVAVRMMGVETSLPTKGELRTSGVVFAILIAMGPATLAMPSYVVEKLMNRHMGVSVEKLNTCLPNLNAVLGLPEVAPPRRQPTQ